MTHEPTTTLELDDDRHQRLHHREWIAERWGVALMALIIAAALLGALGPGPLSYRTETSADGQFSIEYYALQRLEASEELVIWFETPPAGTELIRLGLSRTFTDRITVEGMTPEPESTELESDRLVYNFRASRLGGKGKIIVRYKNAEFGSIRFVVHMAEGTPMPVYHFVFP